MYLCIIGVYKSKSKLSPGQMENCIAAYENMLLFFF